MSAEKSLEDKMEGLAEKIIEDAMSDDSSPADRIQALRHLTAFRVGFKKLKLKDEEADEDGGGIFGDFREKLAKTQGVS